MDKVAHHYHQLLTSLTQRLEQGERDIDALEADARRRLLASGDLTPIEMENVTARCGAIWKSSPAVMMKAVSTMTKAFFYGSLKRACGSGWRRLPTGHSWNGKRCSRTLAIMAFTTAARWSVWAIYS